MMGKTKAQKTLYELAARRSEEGRGEVGWIEGLTRPAGMLE